jgi:SAM-dependent methyltransferase
MTAKYGAGQVARWFHPPGRVVEVALGSSGDSSEAGEAAYFDWLEAEFDSIASDYDRHILGNRINRLLRDRSLRFLRSTFRPNARLLEIGCGSGTETVELLADGHEILAADISERMLETVRAKAKARGLSERLSVVKVRAGAIGSLVAREGAGAFDGIYSTYGALNCEPNLAPIPPALHALLRTEGRFVAGVFNRWCGFETGVFALLVRPRRAWGRHGRPVEVEASRFCVDAFAYSVPEFCRLFAPEFHPLRIEGVPVLLPPSDLTKYVERFSRHFSTLARIDAAAGRHYPFSWLGDHFLVSMAPQELGNSPTTPALGVVGR